MSKKVYLKPLFRYHAVSHKMQASPPNGYEFVLAQTAEQKLYTVASRWGIGSYLLASTNVILPTILVKSWLERWKRPPAGTVLTYTDAHLVFRPEPWVVEVEYAGLLLGQHPKHLKRFGGVLERALASPHCRKILCWSEAGRRTLTAGLNSEKFQHKIEFLPLSVPPKRFVKEYGAGKVKLLFVGSGQIMGESEARGLSVVLETFILLRQRYDNLELVVRADVSAEVKARYGGMENLRLMDKVVPWEMLEGEFQAADIFLLPSHNTHPFVIMVAMSYELPVVTIDAWANGEFVEDGRTGLLAKASKKVPYYYHNTPHPNFGTAEFDRAIRVPDPQVVGELAQKVSLLIENPELRRRLGKAGRHEVEDGRFSIAKTNEKLKWLFDEATCPVPQKH